MLPASSRLRRQQDFTETTRRGSKAAGRFLVVHLRCGAFGPEEPAQVGFAVGRAIGGSVSRHRVVRRLRHVVRARLTRFPAGSSSLVRALPAARTAKSAELARDLDAVLDRMERRA